MMVGTVFDVCSVCGGEVTLDDHMVDAHLGELDSREVHLVWAHLRCQESGETVISVQDYKAALSHFRIKAGEVTPRLRSEGDSVLLAFQSGLKLVETVEDLGFTDAS